MASRISPRVDSTPAVTAFSGNGGRFNDYLGYGSMLILRSDSATQYRAAIARS